MSAKKIAVGCDHRGFPLKQFLAVLLQRRGYSIIDFGTNCEEACDYPDLAFQVAEAVQKRKCRQGIVVCGSGVGVSIAANKVRGVRASLCRSVSEAEFSRKHNDANVLALGADYTKAKLAQDICLRWLETDFEGGRHARRVQKIKNYEKKHFR